MIQRLAPSLKPYVGCSIIDLNPGSALWSSKLHDFLRPRSHILVEPEPAYHEPFLRPLLELPGSRYHLRTWPFGESFDLHRYISEGLIPNSQADRRATSASTPRNDSVLIVSNLSRGNRIRRSQGRYISNHSAQGFCGSLQRMDGLNVHGPVRMLMWLPDAEKQALLPRTVFHRVKFSLFMEMYTHIEEIVTAGKQGRERRETFLDLESGEQVARRMKSIGIQIPPNRQDELQRRVQGLLTKSSGDSVARIKDDPREWEKELQFLEEAYANKAFSQHVLDEHVKREATEGPLRVKTTEFKRLIDLRAIQRSGDKRKLAVHSLMEAEDEIDALQVKSLHQELDPREREATTMKRDQLYNSLKARVEVSPTMLTQKLAFHGDDRRSSALRPPLLMWDRRMAEPLLAYDDEFYHSKGMSLLDFQPLTPRPYPMTGEQLICFDHIFNALFHNPKQSMKHLEQVAPGAFDALVPLVPSLTDPLKGGRAKVDELRVRCLTPEMAHQLTLAWEQWPFRPDMMDLIQSDVEMEDLLSWTEGRAQGRG